MAKWENQKTEDLLRTITFLKNSNETKRFLRDLLTEQELIELGNRWQAAKMLNEKIPYSLIQKETGLSSRTIARVSKWLNEGMNGYKTIINKIHHRNSIRTRRGLS